VVAGLVDPDDPGVLQGGERLHLAPEAARARVPCAEDLDRHLAVERRVERQVHVGARPLAERADHVVATDALEGRARNQVVVQQLGRERVEGLGRRRVGCWVTRLA